MRGEHYGGSEWSLMFIGSSPHARGTPQPHQSHTARCPVHPRMRGEHVLSTKDNAFGCGSSPHARGTHSCTLDDMATPRFIPACAGNTASDYFGNGSITVHPRMRGEHIYLERYWLQPGGSSPHARGTRISLMTGRPPRRFIPACAGNTLSRTFTSVIMAVHPRMRGEHLRLDALTMAPLGSSPHARGTR